MNETVLLLKKKKFITWFMQTYRLKRPEAARLLGFLMERDALLVKIHFVENVRYLPNALIISTEDSVTVSFLCRINNVYLEDIDLIIAQLDSSPPEDLFIWLSFSREFLCNICDTVLCVRPEIRDVIPDNQMIRELEEELNFKLQARGEHRLKLLGEIDETLANGNRGRFLKLSALFRELFGN